MLFVKKISHTFVDRTFRACQFVTFCIAFTIVFSYNNVYASNELTVVVPTSSSGIYAVIRNPENNAQGWDTLADDWATYDRTDANQQISMGSAISIGASNERQFGDIPTGVGELNVLTEYEYDIYDADDELIGSFRFIPAYSAQSAADVNVVSVNQDAIEAGDFATGAIDADAIAADAIGASEVATDAIGAAEIAANAITTSEFADSTITANKIATDAITAAKIAADAIGASEMAANAIGAAEIATDAITATKIAADAIGASELAADSIGSSEIATDAIGALEIATDAIGASELAANSIGASEIADNAIDAGAIASNAIGESEIADIAINAATFETDALSTQDSIGGISTVGTYMPSNLIQISDDTVAANNLESSYDGTGFDVGGLDVSEINQIMDDWLAGGRLSSEINTNKYVVPSDYSSVRLIRLDGATDKTPFICFANSTHYYAPDTDTLYPIASSDLVSLASTIPSACTVIQDGNSNDLPIYDGPTPGANLTVGHWDLLVFDSDDVLSANVTRIPIYWSGSESTPTEITDEFIRTSIGLGTANLDDQLTTITDNALDKSDIRASLFEDAYDIEASASDGSAFGRILDSDTDSTFDWSQSDNSFKKISDDVKKAIRSLLSR